MNLADGPRSAGAYHSGDLVYVFNNLERFAVDWTAEDRKIADAMSGYWTEFAKTGNPNRSGLPDLANTMTTTTPNVKDWHTDGTDLRRAPTQTRSYATTFRHSV